MTSTHPVLDRSKAPLIHEAIKLQMPATRELVLDNGTPLTVIDNGELPLHRISVITNGGSAEATTASVPTLLSQLLPEGTRLHSAENINGILDANGSWLRCGAQSHHTIAGIYSINSRADVTIPLFAECVTQPSFPTDRIATMTESLAAAIELNRHKVDYLARIAANRLAMGPGHPLTREDSPDEIRALSGKHLTEFHNRIFTANTTKIFIAGRITPQIEDLLNRRFSDAMTPAGDMQLNVKPFTSADEQIGFAALPDAVQCSVRMMLPTIPRSHPDYTDLRLVIIALGGYFGSRLMTNIREDKGYTYGISSVLYGHHEGGMMVIGSQTDETYLRPLISETLNELRNLALAPLDDEELHRLRNYCTSQLTSQLDTPFTIGDYYESLLTNNIAPGYFDRQWEAISTITPERIRSLADTYLNPKNMRIAISASPKVLTQQLKDYILSLL